MEPATTPRPLRAAHLRSAVDIFADDPQDRRAAHSAVLTSSPESSRDVVVSVIGGVGSPDGAEAAATGDGDESRARSARLTRGISGVGLRATGSSSARGPPVPFSSRGAVEERLFSPRGAGGRRVGIALPLHGLKIAHFIAAVSSRDEYAGLVDAELSPDGHAEVREANGNNTVGHNPRVIAPACSCRLTGSSLR